MDYYLQTSNTRSILLQDPFSDTTLQNNVSATSLNVLGFPVIVWTRLIDLLCMTNFQEFFQKVLTFVDFFKIVAQDYFVCFRRCSTTSCNDQGFGPSGCDKTSFMSRFLLCEIIVIIPKRFLSAFNMISLSFATNSLILMGWKTSTLFLVKYKKTSLFFLLEVFSLKSRQMLDLRFIWQAIYQWPHRFWGNLQWINYMI